MPSYPYTYARVCALEKRLINSEKLKRLMDMNSANDMLRALMDMGYGDGLRVDDVFDYEKLISNDLAVAYKDVRDMSPQAQITNLFFLKYDYQNLKILLKLQILGEQGDDLIGNGTIPVTHLEKAVIAGELNRLPEEMRVLIREAKAARNGSEIGYMADKAMFEQISKELASIDDKNVIKYWETQADYYNIITVFRAKALNDVSLIDRAYLKLGNVKLKNMQDAFSKTKDEAVRSLSTSNLDSGIIKGLDYFLKNDSLSVLEKNKDNFFIDMFKPLSRDMFSIACLIGYLLAKEQEASIVRVIMVAKINSIPQKLVEERLRDLYE